MADEDKRYKVSLAGTMPGEQANGWHDEDFLEELDSDRARVRYARVAYHVHSLREMTATGKRNVTIVLDRIEPVPDEAAASDEQMLTHLNELRTGQATLFPPHDGGA